MYSFYESIDKLVFFENGGTPVEKKGVFDFEVIYKLYPRKGEGKAAGMKRLTKVIRTDEQYMDLANAVKNYVDLCKMNGTERKYIKMWSTFVNNYEDYLDRVDLGLPLDPSEEVWFS